MSVGLVSIYLSVLSLFGLRAAKHQFYGVEEDPPILSKIPPPNVRLFSVHLSVWPAPATTGLHNIPVYTEQGTECTKRYVNFL